MSVKRVTVTQTRSGIRHIKKQTATLRALGLGRIGRTAEHDFEPSIIGMLKKVSHLVTVKPVE